MIFLLSKSSLILRDLLGATKVVLTAALMFTTGSIAHAQTAAQAASAQPTGVQAPARAGAGSVSSYRINAGDQIEINVWGEERLQRELSVLPDGTIAFPLVGQIRVAGALPQEVERMVSDRLRDQYRGEVPFVTVSVKAPAGMRYSILGKVRAPGVFAMNRYVNVLEALSQAGGPDQFANVDNILVIRQSGDKTSTHQVRLGALLKGNAGDRDLARAGLLTIAPGDVIIVP